ncbi:hypothetical protein A3C94_02765 [Candidatus Kaiserbacteria bacterium RIFCSPHIGHO2_02_FULL_55_17]|uniref:Uncharacterized protein n=1 Tax=Candidatus Kaiserbacteria bacterium RIFCSPHIGHO2_02_FULL_55_17 TaxID=1798496 RepID=A0A1F6DSW8_9BACT|nr:MAG: hypothetical protein A3C94_02765 [Candidatus Kaiserbacteria bacterium RIFCSPHIGHO2_02_FULL_55_17]
MTYRNKNEGFHSPEIEGVTQERDAAVAPHLTRAQVEAVSVRRKKMLSTIEADIDARLYGAIRRKIDYESAFLRNLVEADRQALEIKKSAHKILDTQYFIHEPLDTRYFLLP